MLMTFLALPSPTLKQNVDAILWWKSHQDQFPLLANVARRKYEFPANFTASERLFSGSGSIITDRRFVRNSRKFCLPEWNSKPESEQSKTGTIRKSKLEILVKT